MQLKAFGVAFLVAVAGVSGLAHHSHGNYDLTTWTVMEGTVKQVVFIVPHSIVYIDVKGEKGETATWALEATNPQGIFLKGAKKEDVQGGRHDQGALPLTPRRRQGMPAGFRDADARRQGPRSRRRDRVGLDHWSLVLFVFLVLGPRSSLTP